MQVSGISEQVVYMACEKIVEREIEGLVIDPTALYAIAVDLVGENENAVALAAALLVEYEAAQEVAEWWDREGKGQWKGEIP